MSSQGDRKRRESFGLSSTERTKLQCCRAIVGLADRLYQCIIEEGAFKERLGALAPLLLGVKTTSEAVLTLLEAGLVNEAFMLMRPLLERATTFSFLTCCPDEDYEHYVAYGRQKAVRILDRQVQAGKLQYGLRYSESDRIKANPEYARLLEMFTGSKGGEIKRWTSKTLADMIGEVSEHSGAGRLTALTYLAFYERASEALHGTLYGVLVDSGFWDPRPDGEFTSDAHASLHDVSNVILVGVAALLADLFSHANSLLPVSDLIEQCDALRAAMTAMRNRGDSAHRGAS